MCAEFPTCLRDELAGSFTYNDGIFSRLDAELTQHIEAIYAHRETITAQLPRIEDYNELPHSLADQHFEWRIRAYDLRNIADLLRNRHSQTILEIGAWNGWLSHHLVKMGHQLTSIDYFAHPDDGLGAKRHYSVDWQSIQMDVTDLAVFKPCFDVVIVNHGLHFYPDPVSYVAQVKSLLKPGGILILLALTFYRNPTIRLNQLKNMTEQFETKHGFPMFLKPTRGYMDSADQRQVQAMGVQLYRYARLWKANLKAALLPTAPAYYYGVYQQPAV